ncbi:MAG: penicillin-binding protein 1C [Phycisphaeraceae bacterium]
MKKPRFILRLLRRTAKAAIVPFIVAAIALEILWRVSPFPVERLSYLPQSPRVLDRHAQPLMQLVGMDDQWRLPVSLDEISPWLIQATIAVEDERFESHSGVDPIAVLRASGQNMAAGRVVSGASTLTLQVCRMLDDQPRTLGTKAVEALRAMQLEELHTKDEILALYLNLAPYGGNLRGVEAASLAYFGKRAKDLSLGEASLLAGLPQSPSRLRPDRHLERAKARQATVLRRMVETGTLTQARAEEAAGLALVIRAGTLSAKPQAAGAAWLALSRRPLGGQTTIDLGLHREAERLAREHIHTLRHDMDAAVVILDIASGDVLAMVGSTSPQDPRHGQVNAALARRSPGSTLKPFIYGAAFESRRLSERSIVQDIPINRGGWTPRNFDRTFKGEVSVSEALQRSLNVPAILVAEGIGLQRCVGTIEAAGITFPRDAAQRGGLAVVTGAVEVTLLDLTNAYATLGRGGVRQPVRLFADEAITQTPVLSGDSCAMLDDILGTHRRRPDELAMVSENDLPWFMWKTGTSSGRRDAWAIGHNKRFAIGVWIGRKNGAGDERLVGGEAAEPLLARLFALPSLRVMEVPPSAKTWEVRLPLPPPAEATRTLRIVSPATGSTFIAIDGKAIVQAKASDDSGLQWFLNGQLRNSSVDRLMLEPGAYELRCVDADGRWAKAMFVVK